MPNENTIEALDQACLPIFKRLMEDFNNRYLNWLVVIEPISGEYFLGQDDYEVLSRARKKHSKAQFFAYRLSDKSYVDILC